MTQVHILDARSDASGGYKVDVSRGERIGRVSSEWFSRPAEKRHLSLSELFASVKSRGDRSRTRTRTVESAAVRVEASRDDAEHLSLVLPGSPDPVSPTHWSFGQLASLVGAPAAYLRQLPTPLAGINLQYGPTSHRAEQVKTLESDNGRVELRAVTGPDYGRIYDHELVGAVMRIAGDGIGDTRSILRRWRSRAPEALWDALAELDGDARQALFAHCIAQSVNAVVESFNRRPRAIAHADRLAQALELDMAAAGWTPTVDGFLGRVTKPRILGAVTEARGARAAARIDHLKKGEMAEQAEVLLAGSGWLPELLRTPGRALPTVAEFVDVEAPASDGGEPAMVEGEEPLEDELADSDAVAIAAE